jgi:hypothetical protein
VRSIAPLTSLGFVRGESFGTAPRDLWDRASELVVEISSGPDLVSVTEDEALAGVNRAYVGGELLAYASAELLRVEFDARIYKLTDLLRGLSDTPIQEPVVNSRFVPIQRAGSIGFEPHNLSDVGTSWEYKAVPPGYAEADIGAIVVRVTGRTVRPRAPAHFTAADDIDTADVVFSWLRKTRSPWLVFAPSRTPLEETFLGFRIIVSDDLGAEVRRFEPTEDTPAMAPEIRDVTYTAAQQTTDSLTSGDVMTITVVQVSDLVGDGDISTITWTVP